MSGAAFLRNVLATLPYAIHTVLTDNGMAFADLPIPRRTYRAVDGRERTGARIRSTNNNLQRIGVQT
jgi:hypothetical protein